MTKCKAYFFLGLFFLSPFVVAQESINKFTAVTYRNERVKISNRFSFEMTFGSHKLPFWGPGLRFGYTIDPKFRVSLGTSRALDSGVETSNHAILFDAKPPRKEYVRFEDIRLSWFVTKSSHLNFTLGQQYETERFFIFRAPGGRIEPVNASIRTRYFGINFGNLWVFDTGLYFGVDWIGFTKDFSETTYFTIRWKDFRELKNSPDSSSSNPILVKRGSTSRDYAWSVLNLKIGFHI
ncbi:MAG: hypothetical protein HRU19_30600 [Pseudobacteriovorax sp.]|nr:hypothetical protein [Pseudobacteriovorax sp.]